MQRRIFVFCFLFFLTHIAYNQTHALEFFLKEGIQNSPLLKEYRNQIRSAVSDSLLVRAAKKPFIDAKSQLQYSPFYRGFGYDEVITDGGNYMAIMGVTQNIFNRREQNNKYNGVTIQKQFLNNSARISTSELNKIITDQYLTSYLSYSDFLFNGSFLELFEKENEIVKQFVINGIYKQTDYLALIVETQTQEILVSQLKSQYRKDMMLLNRICGINDSVWYELVDPQLEIMGIPEIEKTPSYIKFKLDSLRLENEKTAIDLRYKPKVNWFADAGFLSSNPWNFYNHFGYSAGVGLNIPVYDGKQRVIEKQKLEFEENSRKAYEESYHKQYFQQIQQLRDELKVLNEISVRMTNQIKTSGELVKALKDQLEAGIIQMTEYIIAIKNFKSISRNINLVNIQKLQVINEINFLLTQ